MPDFLERLMPSLPEPVYQRMGEALAMAGREIVLLLAGRAKLVQSLHAQTAPEPWADIARRLVDVEREINEIAPSLDPWLQPTSSVVPFHGLHPGDGVPVPVCEQVCDWLARNVVPEVLAFVDVPVVLTEQDRPYTDLTGIFVRRDTPAHVYAHEVGHVIEDRIPAVRHAANLLHLVKTRGGKIASLSQVMREWRPEETVKLGFADPYWGRIPGEDGYTEVTSGGFGAMMHSPGLLLMYDPLVYGFVRAVMAGEIA